MKEQKREITHFSTNSTLEVQLLLRCVELGLVSELGVEHRKNLEILEIHLRNSLLRAYTDE